MKFGDESESELLRLEREKRERQYLESLTTEGQTGKRSKNISTEAGLLIFIVVIGCFCWYGYNQLNTPDPKTPNPTPSISAGPWRAEHPLPVPQIPKPQPAPSWLIVKGFYIGMPVESLNGVLEKLATWNIDYEWGKDLIDAASIRVIRITNWSDYIESLGDKLEKPEELFGVKEARSIILETDRQPSEDGAKVQRILIGAGACEHLFQSHDLTDHEFAQTFVNAYHIPEMDEAYDKTGNFLEYVRGDIRVRIYYGTTVGGKSLRAVHIEKVAPQNEIKKNFN